MTPSKPSAPASQLAAVAHACTADEVQRLLDVDATAGLSAQEVARRLAEHGRNEVSTSHAPSIWALIWDAVTEPFVVLLLIAGVLAVAVGEVRDGLLVLVGLLPIVGADLITSYRGERALDALRDSAAPRALARRDGGAVEIPAADVVPGDVILLAVGDVVPADVRLARAEGLLVDRSVLTGESVPEPGSVEPDAIDRPLVDQHSMAFAGTRIVQGWGEGIVVATGDRSQLGRIAAGLGREERRRSLLQLELDRLVRILLVVAIGLVVITSGLALLRGEPLGVALLAGVAAAIAAIPEEPPVLLAVILGLGAYRLLRRNVLVRRLSAQETLSAVDLILTDKTGTLTQNRLSLEAAYTPGGGVDADELRRLATLALRAQDDAWQRGRGGRAGSFTAALERFLGDSNVPELDGQDLVEAEPAGGSHPYTRTVAKVGGGLQELVLGAPEVVLGLTADGDDANPWRTLVDSHADEGRRLLLLAERRPPEGSWQPLGLICFSDPLRPDVRAALMTARDAGIQTVIVTGDHPRTTARIAEALGLDEGGAITGAELASWDDDQLCGALKSLRVVARALPEQKLRIVEAARQSGRTVAVTGDGVNDAPALEHADVAVAMGSGSAVAREASDLVLGDDSFATLMNGLREGRRIVANVEKGLIFLVSTHVALLGFVLIASLYGFSQPLLPIHILWLELFIDVTASVAFEREPEEPGSMRTPPRSRARALLSPGLLARISGAGAWTAAGALVVMATHPGGLEHARWVAFNVLVFSQVVRAYANRSLTKPLWRLKANWLLLGVCVVALAVQLAIPYVPALAEIVDATPLAARDWVLIAIVALTRAVLAQVIRASTRRPWVA